ncbi:adenine-specific methyltransferase EcoRI family protein, partial [Sphingobium yanoikuyae]|uniref:adenine-specific methyltransferase EcoRI family protein n=1 Tax=Sphingobium yanoikuyae TaxID=13690 RepID=UPI0026F10D98
MGANLATLHGSGAALADIVRGVARPQTVEHHRKYDADLDHACSRGKPTVEEPIQRTNEANQLTMARNATNQTLKIARSGKNDEFYTVLSDIEKELKHYRRHFEDKVVLCNCDDPRISNFFHYFSYNFEMLKLKRLITTCYKNDNMDLFSRNQTESAVWLDYLGDKNGNRVPDINEIGVKDLKGDGDFRSPECVSLLESVWKI